MGRSLTRAGVPQKDRPASLGAMLDKPQALLQSIDNIIWGIVLNAIFRVILYKLSKRYVSPSEFTAVMVAALFPIGKSGFELMYHRQLDPISIFVLPGIGAGIGRAGYLAQIGVLTITTMVGAQQSTAWVAMRARFRQPQETTTALPRSDLAPQS